MKVLTDLNENDLLIKALKRREELKFNRSDDNDLYLATALNFNKDIANQFISEGKVVSILQPDTAIQGWMKEQLGVNISGGYEFLTVRVTQRDSSTKKFPYFDILTINTNSSQVERQTFSDEIEVSEVTKKEPVTNVPTEINDVSPNQHDLEDIAERLVTFISKSPEVLSNMEPPWSVNHGIFRLTTAYTMQMTPESRGWDSGERKAQKFSGETVRLFYVYHENGNRLKNRYKVFLISKSTARHPGLVHDEPPARFFMRQEALCSVQDKTESGILKLREFHRKSPSPSEGSIITDTSLEVRVLVLGDGGQRETVWTAMSQVEHPTPGWGVVDSSQDDKLSWRYHQRELWDPVSLPVSSFGTWWKQMYSGGHGGDVKTFPNQSVTNLNYETHATWTFQFHQGRTEILKFETQDLIKVAGFANPKGYNGKNHRLNSGAAWVNRSISFNPRVLTAAPTSSQKT